MSRSLKPRIVAVVLFASATAVAAPRATQKPTKVASKRAANAAPRAYVQAMTGWHAPILGKTLPVDSDGRPMLVLSTINRNERGEFPVLTSDGDFSAREHAKIAHLLRSASGDEHPIEPRTLKIIYGLQRRFSVPEIRVVSGYRVPKPNSHSNHGKGRAIDFIIPGVPDADVANVAREIGFVGVGIYPVSGFVHVDVRPRSYFWVDSSGPGKKNRERGIFPELAAQSDKRASERGMRSVDPFNIGTDVDAALQTRALINATAEDDDEDADEAGGG